TNLRDRPAGLYSPPTGLERFLLGTGLNWTGVVFRRKVAFDAGLLDADAGTVADIDFLVRIAAKYSYLVSTNPGALYFRNPKSSILNASANDLLNQRMKVLRNLETNTDLTEEERARLLQMLKAYMGHRLFLDACLAKINRAPDPISLGS